MPQVPNNVKFGVPLMLVSFVVFAIALFVGVEVIKPEAKPAEAGQAEGGGAAGGPVSLTLVAKNITFDKRLLAASPGSSVSVTLDNQDAGVIHNVAFYRSKASLTQPLVAGAKGNLLTGPAKETFTFTAPGAGTYYYQCDVHPDQMNGSFVVR